MLKFGIISGAVLALTGCVSTYPDSYAPPDACNPATDANQCRESEPRQLCPLDPESCAKAERDARRDDDFYQDQQETGGTPYPRD